MSFQRDLLYSRYSVREPLVKAAWAFTKYKHQHWQSDTIAVHPFSNDQDPLADT